MNSSVATLAEAHLNETTSQRARWAPPLVPPPVLQRAASPVSATWLHVPPPTPQEPLRLAPLPASPEDLPFSKLNRRNVLTGIGISLGAAVVVSSCSGGESVEDVAMRVRPPAEEAKPKLTPDQTPPGGVTDSSSRTSGGSAEVFDDSVPKIDSRRVAKATDPAPTATPAGPPSTSPAPAAAPAPAAPAAAPAPAVPPAAVVPAAVVPPAAPSTPTPTPTPPAAPVTPPTPPTPPAPPPPPPGPTAAELDAMHRAQLLGRIPFGATALEVDQVASLGPVAFLDQQLSTPPADTSGVLTGTHSLDADIATRYALYQGEDSRRPAKELRHAAVIRAARHPGQLAERMVDFWTNHFSTYSGQDDKTVRYAAATDDRDVIRAHAMGKFSDLLLASARSVSMQLYLDNHRSTGRRPNQNYGREIMELHTMGAGNGYDEEDVEQAARIFTGWGLAGRLDTDGLRFEYNPGNHFTDPCAVTIVHPDGSVHTFSTPERPGGIGGEQDGIDFVNWLARRPNTANYLATKLVRRFVSDDPPPSLVASTAAVYLANDTAIVPVLRHILTSNEFITNQSPKVRSPFELLVSMVRATGAVVY